MAWFDRWVTLWETQRRSKPTCSFLGLGHQLVVFLKGELHGFPLGSHLKRQIFLYRFKQSRNVFRLPLWSLTM